MLINSIRPTCMSRGGSEVPTESAGPWEGSHSACEPLRKVILAKLEQGLSAQRIWEDLWSDHGFGYGYDSVIRLSGQVLPQGTRQRAPSTRVGQTRPIVSYMCLAGKRRSPCDPTQCLCTSQARTRRCRKRFSKPYIFHSVP